MIVLAHLALFAVLFAFGLPLVGQSFAGVSFVSGVTSVLLLTFASEILVILAALFARMIAVSLSINPLLHRRSAEAISHLSIVLSLTAFWLVISSIYPETLSVSLPWSLGFAILTVAILDVMVRVKRFWVARSYR